MKKTTKQQNSTVHRAEYSVHTTMVRVWAVGLICPLPVCEKLLWTLQMLMK